MAAAEKPPKVFGAIIEVMSCLVELGGIAKGQRNSDQNYNFRGIDDVYNALSRLLVAHKLVILPRVLERRMQKRPTRNGSIMFNVALHVEFDMISSEDASKYTISTWGEASDMADKATNKAMSAAYKYAVIQAFCIPVEVPDADAETPPDTADPSYSTASQKAPASQHQPASKAAAKGKAAAQQPASQGQPAQGGKPMLTVEQIAQLQIDIDAAQFDEELKGLALDFLDAFQPKVGAPRISLPTAKEIAGSIAAKRAELTTSETVESYKKMLNAFEKAQLIGAQSKATYLNSVKGK